MRIKMLCPGLAALCVLTMLGGGPAFGQENSLERRIVIFEKWRANPAAQRALLESFGARPVLALPLVNGMAAALPQAAIAALARNREVLRIDNDPLVHASARPAQPGKDKGDGVVQPPQQLPWGVDRIDAEYTWAQTRGAGTKVAVLDTGIDLDHPDLMANVKGGRNFVSSPPWKPANPERYDDDNGHGTHVAGIIAALDNEIGSVGVAPDAALYAVKVLDRNGSGCTSQVIAGLGWAVAEEMHVVNMSLSSPEPVPSLEEACNKAAAAGILLVAAAGNDGGPVNYPAAYPAVLAVAATDSTDDTPYWSSRGPEIHIAAPGVAIFSTYFGGGYQIMSGTSMAAPHVTGTLALNRTAIALCHTATLLPADQDIVGCGLVDAGMAVTNDSGNDLPVQ